MGEKGRRWTIPRRRSPSSSFIYCNLTKKKDPENTYVAEADRGVRCGVWPSRGGKSCNLVGNS
eukprot:scaffold14920_cov63-Cylindrotheca_fusiformis.AAC.2